MVFIPSFRILNAKHGWIHWIWGVNKRGSNVRKANVSFFIRSGYSEPRNAKWTVFLSKHIPNYMMIQNEAKYMVLERILTVSALTKVAQIRFRVNLRFLCTLVDKRSYFGSCSCLISSLCYTGYLWFFNGRIFYYCCVQFTWKEK